MANDLDIFAAKTQARITYSLLGGFLGLMFTLLLIGCLPVKMDDKLLSVLDRIVTALLPIVGSAVGFWVARHRTPTGTDELPSPSPSTLANTSPLVPSSLQEKKS